MECATAIPESLRKSCESAELLEFLFESLPPNRHLFFKDANGKRPLDYLLANWTDANAPLLMTVQKWMIARLDNWGATEGMESMQSKVSEILDAGDNEQRSTLTDGLLAHFERYENAEATSILEMALWKSTLRCGWSTDGSERQALDREECLRVSGSNVVLPNVWNFLAAAPQTSSN